MTFSYWKNHEEFAAQTQLLEDLFNEQGRGYAQDGNTSLSLETLGDKQRAAALGCVYLAGSRVDNKFCLGSKNVGILHSSLPTDYAKAITPAFHGDHEELMLCTGGQVVIEYSQLLSSDAPVEIITINPGDYFIVKRGWPHRLSLAPLRVAVDDPASIKQAKANASYLVVKMGTLSGKSAYEDMTKWKGKFTHPIITNWEEDDAFLTQLRKERHDVCRSLHISPI